MLRTLFPACAVMLLPCLAHGEAKLLRHPTYSKGRIAFSYLGDIWIVNEDGKNPERLTDNKAHDYLPRFSPDGNSIAFSSNRAGNYDVFVMPSTGGAARQLTFNTADDLVVGWTPDGSKIVFMSERGAGVYPAGRLHRSPDRSARQIRSRCVGGEFAVLKTAQIGARHHPQGARVVFIERQDAVVG